MLEAPEVDPHHHKSGHSRIDLIIGCLAVLMSSISIYIAIRHGHTMEQLVAANSWPNLTYGTSNASEDGLTPILRFDIRNTGVGPARIESFQVFYKGKLVATPNELLAQCCGHGKYSYSTSNVLGEVLPARDQIEFLSLRQDQNRAEAWATLNQERFKMEIQLCYCSVFDECWSQKSGVRRPARVEQCNDTQNGFGL